MMVYTRRIIFPPHPNPLPRGERERSVSIRFVHSNFFPLPLRERVRVRGRNDSVHRVCTVATVLTFDELTNREIIPQTYGDLIATANTGSFVYGDLVGRSWP